MTTFLQFYNFILSTYWNAFSITWDVGTTNCDYRNNQYQLEKNTYFLLNSSKKYSIFSN